LYIVHLKKVSNQQKWLSFPAPLEDEFLPFPVGGGGTSVGGLAPALHNQKVVEICLNWWFFIQYVPLFKPVRKP
jgi:hypothetical protein